MKKRRLLLVMIISLIFVLVLSFSSAIFELKTVDVVFVKNGQALPPSSETISIRQRILNETFFDYGSSIFFVTNDKYTCQIEYNEPKLKVLSSEKVFPNKLLIKVCSRQPVFYFSTANNAYLLDSDFKILSIVPIEQFLMQTGGELTEISFAKDEREQDHFTFFSLNENVLSCGEFLTQNNKVFASVANFHSYITLDSRISGEVRSLCFNLCDGEVDLIVSTYSGVGLRVCDVLQKFDEKLLKLCNAYVTLQEKEPIKTTHGILQIDSNKNVSWRA